MPEIKKIIIILLFSLTGNFIHAQLSFTRDTSIHVIENGKLLKMPWAGGQNFCQFSDIDLNFDGKKDLFVFDRSGNKFSTYLNNGTPNTADYSYSDQYTNKFPFLQSWAILLDYNCDGKEDIFTYASPIAGIKVWRNTSSGGNLQFTLEKNYIKSNYNPTVTNLFISQVDIPAIEDVDGDGDMDVLTYDFNGTTVEFHRNLSVENGYGCDSLIFQLDAGGCWGHFSENASNCSINLNQSCRMSFPHESPPLYEVENAHSGSCSLCLDMDADGDKDLIVGDVSCCKLTLLTNGGNAASANMTAYDDSFPSNTKFVQQTVFPCGYFLDVNNDGKRDLLVCPNQPNISFNQKSIWYYQNTNTDNAPVFSYVKNDFLQDEMIDVGEGASPFLFDYTGDGIADLLIANSVLIKDTDSCITFGTSNVYAYKNTGTITSPFFTLDTTDFAGLSSQLPSVNNLYLTFGDLDNDGDQDMMIGDYNGQLFYFTNTAGAGSPCNFELTQSAYPDDGGTPIDVGSNATPQLIDVDRDGLLDMIIGERGGNLNYYKNSGTASSPQFTWMTDSFGKVNVKYLANYGYSVPFMFDYNGSYNLLAGSYYGGIFHYNNIDGNLAGSFTLLDSAYQKIKEGERSTVTMNDINGDYILDMIVGNYRGGVSCWKGYDSLLTNILIQHSFSGLSIYPNPSSGEINIQNTADKIQNIEVYDVLENKVLIQSFNSNSCRLDLSEFESGVYFLKIRNFKNCISRKICLIKQ